MQVVWMGAAFCILKKRKRNINGKAQIADVSPTSWELRLALDFRSNLSLLFVLLHGSHTVSDTQACESKSHHLTQATNASQLVYAWWPHVMLVKPQRTRHFSNVHTVWWCNTTLLKGSDFCTHRYTAHCPRNIECCATRQKRGMLGSA